MARSIDFEKATEGSPIDPSWSGNTPKMIELGPIERYVVSDWLTGSHTDCDSEEEAHEVYERLTALGHDCMILQIRRRIGRYS